MNFWNPTANAISLCLYLRHPLPFSYSRLMRSSSAKSTPEKDLLLIRRFCSSFLARRKWRIFSPSFTTRKTASPRTFRHQTGSLIAHSWLVVKNSPLSTLVLNAVPFPNTICGCCSRQPNNRDRCKLFHSPSRPTAAAGNGVGGSCSRGAMIVRMSGRTCERRRSAAPIMRAIVGIASAPPTRRPKLAVVKRIVRAAAAAKSSSFTTAASACS